MTNNNAKRSKLAAQSALAKKKNRAVAVATLGNPKQEKTTAISKHKGNNTTKSNTGNKAGKGAVKKGGRGGSSSNTSSAAETESLSDDEDDGEDEEDFWPEEVTFGNIDSEDEDDDENEEEVDGESEDDFLEPELEDDEEEESEEDGGEEENYEGIEGGDEEAEEDEDEDEDEEDEEEEEDLDSLDSEDRELEELIREEDHQKWKIAISELSSKTDDNEDSDDDPHVYPISENYGTVHDSTDSGDDSDEEHTTSTIGRIPIHWYEDYPHIGYDRSGNPIMKPATGDALDKFLDTMDDSDGELTIEKDGQKKSLTEQEIEMLEQITGNKFPLGYDPYEPTIEWFTSERSIHPVTNTPEPKSRFIPSKWEHKKVMKLVRAIRKGYIQPKPPKEEKSKRYLLWTQNDRDSIMEHTMHVPAPKMKLPTHHESYNPPPEYLLSKEEMDYINSLPPEERKRKFIPKQYSSLRHVPAYDKYFKERFDRCLDLYLCPRVRKNRINIAPESLLPKLPKPAELRPYPTNVSVVYNGHTDKIRSLSVDPTGIWLATGSEDQTVRIWEVTTGRCLQTIQVGGVVEAIQWTPNKSLSFLAFSTGNKCVLFNPKVAHSSIVENTDAALKAGSAFAPNPKSPVVWSKPTKEEEALGYRLTLELPKPLKQLVWHWKGDYLATVSSDAAGSFVHIHQVSKHQSQNPFKKLDGAVQCVTFHPVKPHFFVATQRYVRVYNLMKQEMMKKLMSGVKWISSLDVHPGGDNVIIGSYDKKLCWFDMDLSVKPYKVLRYHNYAIRKVSYHKKFPLFASCSDDASIHIFHGTVYNDLLQNPLIVPVKILRGHNIVDHLGILDIQFHPNQPWIFSCGADEKARLYT